MFDKLYRQVGYDEFPFMQFFVNKNKDFAKITTLCKTELVHDFDEIVRTNRYLPINVSALLKDIESKKIKLKCNVIVTTSIKNENEEVPTSIYIEIGDGRRAIYLDSIDSLKNHQLNPTNELSEDTLVSNMCTYISVLDLGVIKDDGLDIMNDYFISESVVVKIGFLCNGHGGFYTNMIEVKKPVIDLKLNYNEDFQPIHKKIEDFISKKNKSGIVLLYGLPGTGKTTYIKHLMTMNPSKSFIYVPVNLVPMLTDPSFMGFLIENKNVILIIEDAEKAIKSRNISDNDSVSSILNISDGILGDGLNIKIIATFNSKIEDIDEALMRKGRLVVEYAFKKLSKDKAKLLADSLTIENNIDEDMTLAEIYNYDYDNNVTNNKKENKIGFNK